MARRIVSVATDTILARKKTSDRNDTTAEPTTSIKAATNSLSVVPSRDKRRQEKAADLPASAPPALDKRPTTLTDRAPHTEP